MSSANPRLDILRLEAEQNVLSLLHLHSWSAKIVRELDRDSCITIAARRGHHAVRCTLQ